MSHPVGGALRTFLVGCALLTTCTGQFSPTQKTYRVAYFSGSTEAENATQVGWLRQALGDLGYVEGRNVTFDFRYGEGYAERAPALAAELVALKPDVLVTRGTKDVRAVKQATSTIPVVFVGPPDVVENGLVASLGRPGGNVTGAAGAGAEVVQRRLQLLKETIPGTSHVAQFFDASVDSQVRQYEHGRAAAAALGIDLEGFGLRAPEDFADAFATAGRHRPDASLVNSGVLLSSQRARILDFLFANRLPAIFAGSREWVDRGGLMFYDEDTVDLFRRAASYVDRILKGANPADMPVERPSKFELIINMGTAKALGLTIPKSVLDQATEVIQ